MSRATVLLLEDDPAIAATAAFALRREGWDVTQVLLVREAEHLLRVNPPTVAVFDIGLPDGSGLDLLRTLRSDDDPRIAALPLLLLSARSEEIDRVLGLELGADDYMAKPFSPRELVARVRALMRRAALSPPAAAPAAPLFELDEPGMRIRYAGHWLALTRLEYGLLRTLLAAPTRIHSRESLLRAVWGEDSDASDRTVDTHVKTLRAKLRELDASRDPIATYRGQGYGISDDARG